ncbi:MAG: DUF366 family protein [Candidatus Hodarchaeales archaeon]
MNATPSLITFKMLTTETAYDGSQIRPLWAFEKQKIRGDSIICFLGPMSVKSTNIIDLQDIHREGKLAEILISSDESLNFVIEHFDCQPPNLLLAYHRLRLLVFIMMEIVRGKFHGKWHREGTDLYLTDKKISVGIATVSNTSMKIHFAINTADTGFPAHVNATGLVSLGNLDRKIITDIAREVGRRYSDCIEGCWDDINKSKTLSK